MIEYVDEDAKEIGGALKTLILKCTNNKSYELDCTITFGELALDCHFNFKRHEEIDTLN